MASSRTTLRGSSMADSSSVTLVRRQDRIKERRKRMEKPLLLQQSEFDKSRYSSKISKCAPCISLEWVANGPFKKEEGMFPLWGMNRLTFASRAPSRWERASWTCLASWWCGGRICDRCRCRCRVSWERKRKESIISKRCLYSLAFVRSVRRISVVLKCNFHVLAVIFLFGFVIGMLFCF